MGRHPRVWGLPAAPGLHGQVLLGYSGPTLSGTLMNLCFYAAAGRAAGPCPCVRVGVCVCVCFRGVPPGSAFPGAQELKAPPPRAGAGLGGGGPDCERRPRTGAV